MLIDNKKTKEISWGNFKLEGNKENLIKQGWESFEPYGSGKLIYESSFDERWNNQFSEGATGVREANVVKKTNGLGRYDIWRKIDKFEDIGAYVTISVKTNIEGKMMVKFGATPIVESEHEVELIADGEFHIYEFYLTDLGNNNLLIGFFEEGVYELGDLRMSNNNDRHLIVEKTPLENGLTRVQTWGGSADMKLKSPNFGQLAETGTDMTISLYVENNSDSMIRFSNNLAIGGEPYPDGDEYMITVPREYKGFAYLKGEQVGRDVELDIRSDGNIDMIVSQPEIIEGHDLNAMMFMDELEDGRTHVRVFNPNQNTKLVYTGDKGIVGSPYTLSTEIENDGIPFKIKTSLTDDITVNEGINVINKSGELKEEDIKIEIGVD